MTINNQQTLHNAWGLIVVNIVGGERFTTNGRKGMPVLMG